MLIIICCSGHRDDKNHGVGLGDSSSESGDDIKQKSTHQQSQSCDTQQQTQSQTQQQLRMVDHQHSPSIYHLSGPVVVPSPQTHDTNYTSVNLSHSHTPTHHIQHRDTSSESGDDKKNFHHHLHHHFQGSTHSGHSTSMPTSETNPISPSCAQQKSQLDYIQYYGAQVREITQIFIIFILNCQLDLDVYTFLCLDNYRIT